MHHVLAHFAQVDPQLHHLITTREFALEPLTPITDSRRYFAKLCTDIISQQLAGAAAQAIINRFLDLLPGHQLTPANILTIPDQTLRDIGLSWAKVRYIKDLAQKTVEKKILYDQFSTLANEEIIINLTQVKGIGRWTAEMFLLFTLGREDIFSFGDLALKKAFMNLYGVIAADVIGAMTEITPRWAPYRSYASLMLWKSLDQKQTRDH